MWRLEFLLVRLVNPVKATFVTYISGRSTESYCTNAPSSRRLGLFPPALNHTEQSIEPPWRQPTLEEPVEGENRKLSDIFLDTVFSLRPIMENPAKEVPAFLSAVYFALCRMINEFQLLHRASDGLLGVQAFEVVLFHLALSSVIQAANRT